LKGVKSAMFLLEINNGVMKTRSVPYWFYA
jgi:hypothetical protein